MKLDYQLERKPGLRSLRLKIDDDGQVIVRAPRLVPKLLIEQFVASNESWIIKKRAALTTKKTVDNGVIQLFGKKYQLQFGYQPSAKTGFILREQVLFYNNSSYLLAPKTTTKLTTKEKELLEKFLRQTIKVYLNNRLPTLAAQMGLSDRVGTIRVKKQTSRWGSCSADGNLNFNYQLIHYDPAAIDYVLIHELAHLRHLNHSAQFWALVAKYDGDYRLHQRLLR